MKRLDKLGTVYRVNKSIFLALSEDNIIEVYKQLMDGRNYNGGDAYIVVKSDSKILSTIPEVTNGKCSKNVTNLGQSKNSISVAADYISKELVHKSLNDLCDLEEIHDNINLIKKLKDIANDSTMKSVHWL